MTRPFLWAHRGASCRAPENTLAAFFEAIASGADGIVLDLHLSRDGIPVVIHDDTLERTTDGCGAVGSATAQQLQRLDAGNWFAGEFAGKRSRRWRLSWNIFPAGCALTWSSRTPVPGWPYSNCSAAAPLLTLLSHRSTMPC